MVGSVVVVDWNEGSDTVFTAFTADEVKMQRLIAAREKLSGAQRQTAPRHETRPQPLSANEVWLKAHQQWNREVAAEIARTRAELPYQDQWHDRVEIVVGYLSFVLFLFVVVLLATA